TLAQASVLCRDVAGRDRLCVCEPVGIGTGFETERCIPPRRGDGREPVVRVGGGGPADRGVAVAAREDGIARLKPFWGGTGFQPVCISSHRLEAGATRALGNGIRMVPLVELQPQRIAL